MKKILFLLLSISFTSNMEANMQEKTSEVDCSLFTFEIIDDNSVAVAASEGSNLSGDIVIPSETTIGGKTYTVKYVAQNGFFGCDGITNITLPESLEEIDNYAFRNCTRLEEVTIPLKVNRIGWGVFAGDVALKNIKIDSGNKSFAYKDGMLLSADGKTLLAYACGYPAEYLIMPETVEDLYFHAFEGCDKLKSIKVASRVTSLPYYVFMYCRNLIDVDLPDGIEEIDDMAFAFCNQLRAITIPQFLKTLGSYVYYGCTSIDSVLVRQRFPLEIPTDLFEDYHYQDATLYIPTGSMNHYKEIDGWAQFVNVKEIDMKNIETSVSPYDNIEQNQMILGYYTTNDISDEGYGGNNAGIYKACVGYNKEQMIPFTGNRITNVRFALVNNNVQDVRVFIGSSRDKKDLCEQKVTTLKEGWNEILLSVPVEITGDSVFLGIEYMQNENNHPIACLDMLGERGSCLFYGPYNGSNKESIWLDDESMCLCVQCIVQGEKIPLYDIHTTGITINQKYLKTGEDCYGYLYFRNWGKKNVNTVTSVCEIDGKEVAASTSNVPFSQGIKIQKINFGADNTITPGLHNISMRIKEINGEAPSFPSDDVQSSKVKIYSQNMGREKVMLELYTATWCPYTPRTHRSISKLMEERDDIVLVCNHIDDALSCDASDAYSFFAEFTPTIYYDRYAEYGATGLDGYIDVDWAKKQPSLAILSISAEYSEGSREVYITVRGVKNDEFISVEQYANLTVLLTEDSIVYPQYDGDKDKYIYDYVHNGVLRTNASAIWGDPVSWDGDMFEKTYTVKINEEWNKDNMKVVAFLAKPFNGSNYEEIGLVNCMDFSLRDAYVITGVNGKENREVAVYANGRSVGIKGNYKSMQIYTMGGAIVENDNLQTGTYIVKVYAHDGIIIKKISIR